MSGLFKGIGKVFKKVVKVIKKIALPALAIAAVIVTGGAALGLIPMIGGIAITGVGSLATALGASTVVAGILSTAATGATIGFLGGLVTTGSLSGAVKGATTGLVTGAAFGGISAALGGGIGGAASGAGQVAGDIPGLDPGSLFAPASMADTVAGLPGMAGDLAGTATTAAGIGGAVQGGMSAAGTSAASGGGVLDFLNRNPLLASGVIKGIGGALSGNPAADELRRRRRSYEGLTVYDPYEVGSIDGLQSPDERYNTIIYGQGKYEYDPVTGRVLPKGS